MHIIELLYKFFDDVCDDDAQIYSSVVLFYAKSFLSEILKNYERIEDLSKNEDSAINAMLENLESLYSENDYKTKEIYNDYILSKLTSINEIFNYFKNKDLSFYLTKDLNKWTKFKSAIDFSIRYVSLIDKVDNVNNNLKFYINFIADSKYLKDQVKSNVIPIVFATNDRYFAYLSVAIESLKRNANKNYFYDIYVFNSGLPDQNKYKLILCNEDNFHIRFIDVSDLIQNSTLYERSYFSIEMYYRLLIPEILRQYEKILYLDCDIVVLSDISELYKYEIGNNILAVVGDRVTSPGQKDYVNNAIKVGEDNYFNSGVLLINSNQFLNNNIKNICFNILQKFKKLSCPDQDALNIACKGKVMYLPETWNFQNGRASYTVKDRYEKVLNIIHYTSAKKPWNTKELLLSEYFWYYARKTMFYEDILLELIKNSIEHKSLSDEVANKSPAIVNKSPSAIKNRNIINSQNKIQPKKSNTYNNAQNKKSIISWPFRMTKKFFSSLKKDGVKITLKRTKRKIKYIFDRMLGKVDRDNNDIINYKKLTKKRYKQEISKLNEIIKTANQSPDIIVSLTSYPARIGTINQVIQSIKAQSLKPTKIILWLANSQFPKKERDLPKKLLKLKDKIFEIKWCEDIRSYKKLIPTLELYPNKIIVTADDDNIYARDWLKKLYASHIIDPNCIIAHRVTKFVLDANNNFQTIAGGKQYYHCPSYLNKLVGAGGVLYPPNSLYKDIINKELFMSLAPTNDDQWFWFMAILKGYKVKVCENPIIDLKYVDGTQETALSNINDHGENLFWVQFDNLINAYPKVKTILIHDYYNMAKNHLDTQNFGDWFYYLSKNKQLIEKNYYDTLSVDEYNYALQDWFYTKTGIKFDIENPQSLSEKIQWIKIYDANIMKSHLTDKWLAKEYVKSLLGEQYIIKSLGVYDNFDDIDFSKLPNKFVIKSTHGSGQLAIVRDKNSVDMKALKAKAETWLKSTYAFHSGFEMHYQNIIPRLIIEELVDGIDGDLYDYKVMCFNGKPEFIWVDADRFKDHKRTLFDLNWNKIPVKYHHQFCDKDIPKPKKLKKLLEISEKLSAGFTLCRCDFYILPDDSIKFGELTFTSASGIDRFDPISFDYELGKKLILPKKKLKFKKYPKQTLLGMEKEFLNKYRNKKKK